MKYKKIARKNTKMAKEYKKTKENLRSRPGPQNHPVSGQIPGF
jgi:hypothetical protein